MSKSTIEWYMTESDADWQALSAAHVPDDPPPLAPPAHRRLDAQRYLEAVTAILFLLAITCALWWRTAQAGVQRSEADMRAIVQAEFATGSGAAPLVTFTGDQPRSGDWFQHAGEAGNVAAAIQTVTPDDHLDEAVYGITVQGDQSLARLVVLAKDGAPAYRQTRFYRRTPDGWQPSPLDADLWGPAQRLETPSFVFHFHRNDAAAVVAVASQLETLYNTLRNDYGLALTPGAEKLVIEVSLAQAPGDASWFIAPQRLVVASPARYRAPVEVSDAELLAQSLALPLLDVVLAQANMQHALAIRWEPLLGALHLWEMWEMDLPLAVWQDDLVHWIYGDMASTTPAEPLVLPKRYQELCTAHEIWMVNPLQIDIPLTCADAMREVEHLAFWYALGPPTHLEQFALPVSSDPYVEAASKGNQTTYAGQTIVLTTIIDYAVATYGREHLPALVIGLGQHNTWETLLPAVFGVSATEFEAGWQAYLTDRYGILQVSI